MKAISMDLRRRVVESHTSKKGGGYKKLAVRFQIGVNTVRSWVKLKKLYNNISPRPHGGGVPPKILESQWPDLKALVAEKSDRTILELAYEWNKRNNTDLHPSSMGRALIKSGLRFKKNT